MSADEVAAVSSGVDPLRAKTVAFFLGASIAGIAGALFAAIFSYVDPGQSDFTISAMILAMVVIGGAGHVWGALVGALLVGGYDAVGIRWLGTWLDRLHQTSFGARLPTLDVRDLSVGIFGLALYLTMLVRARRRDT
jgi:branched-chain amino acid transport system permease protein